MRVWNLDKLYKGFDDVEYKSDLEKVDKSILEANSQIIDFENYDNKLAKLNRYLNNEITLNNLIGKLFRYASLTSAVETTNQDANKMTNLLRSKLTELTKLNTLFVKWVAKYPELEKDIENNPFLKEHEFFLNEVKEQAAHMLDDELEILVAKLRQTGSTAWGTLQSLLTSTLEVEYDGKIITLSEVRNMAEDPDPVVRRKAYEAELKSYAKIDKSVAASLNSIKGEVNTISKARGFKSPLDQALYNSRMSMETLEAMQAAVMDYIPVFREYLKRKAELLGHENGLPFYDLYAPIGEANKRFSID